MLTSKRWMCVLLLGAMVGTVQAGAVKIRDFVPVLNGEADNGESDGMAIFNFPFQQSPTVTPLGDGASLP